MKNITYQLVTVSSKHGFFKFVEPYDNSIKDNYSIELTNVNLKKLTKTYNKSYKILSQSSEELAMELRKQGMDNVRSMCIW